MINIILISCAIIAVFGIVITMIIILSVRHNMPKQSSSKDNRTSLEPFENYQRIAMLINDKIRDFSRTMSSELKSRDKEIKDDIYTDFKMLFAKFYLNDASVLVPRCLIEAKEKGYFDKNNFFLINGTKFIYHSLKWVDANKITITVNLHTDECWSGYNFINFSIPYELLVYEDGMWAELNVVKPEEKKEVKDNGLVGNK